MTNVWYVKNILANCDGNMYLPILHLPRVELHCRKLHENLHRVTGPFVFLNFNTYFNSDFMYYRTCVCIKNYTENGADKNRLVHAKLMNPGSVSDVELFMFRT